jgi:hypothetical protein
MMPAPHRTEVPLAASVTTYRASTRAQWAAVFVTVLACAGLAIGLPRAADAVKPQDSALTSGERVEAGGVSIVPSEGWVKAAGSPFLTINKGPAGLNIFTPNPDATSAEDAVRATEAGFTDATVSEVAAFTTDSGLTGAIATAEQATAMTVLIALSDGSRLATGLLTIDPASWPDFQDEVQAMLKTVEFTGEAAS